MVAGIKGGRSKASAPGKFVVQRWKGSLEGRHLVQITVCMEAGPELVFSCNVDGCSTKAQFHEYILQI